MKFTMLVLTLLIIPFCGWSQKMVWQESDAVFLVKPVTENSDSRLYIGDSIWINKVGYLQYNDEIKYDSSRIRRVRFANGIFNSVFSLNRVDSLYKFYKNSHYLVYLPDFPDNDPILSIKLKNHTSEKSISKLIGILKEFAIVDSSYVLSGDDVAYRDQGYLFGQKVLPKQKFENSNFPPELCVKFRFDVFILSKFEELIQEIKSQNEVLNVDFVENFRAGNKGEVFGIKT